MIPQGLKSTSPAITIEQRQRFEARVGREEEKGCVASGGVRVVGNWPTGATV
jgi:hypothetical protein